MRRFVEALISAAVAADEAVGRAGAQLAHAVRYGRPEQGGLWWFRTRNLSSEDNKADLPLKGQAILNIAPSGVDETHLRLEWSLISRFMHVGLRVERSEAEVKVYAALPPVAAWLVLESWPLLSGLTRRFGDRVLELSAHDGSLWWKVWVDDAEWSEETPRWRYGSMNVVDLLLGKQVVETTPTGSPVPIVVPMPEGSYEGSCQMELVRVSRARWPTQYVSRGSIEMKDGIPVPGKGENSWDCDDDATSGYSCPAHSSAEAVGEFVSSVLLRRERYGGRNWTPFPPTFSPAAGGGGGAAPTHDEKDPNAAAAADHKRLADFILAELPHEIGRGDPQHGESAAEVAIRLLRDRKRGGIFTFPPNAEPGLVRRIVEQLPDRVPPVLEAGDEAEVARFRSLMVGIGLNVVPDSDDLLGRNVVKFRTSLGRWFAAVPAEELSSIGTGRRVLADEDELLQRASP